MVVMVIMEIIVIILTHVELCIHCVTRVYVCTSVCARTCIRMSVRLHVFVFRSLKMGGSVHVHHVYTRARTHTHTHTHSHTGIGGGPEHVGGWGGV
jgi:hypothetical protein